MYWNFTRFWNIKNLTNILQTICGFFSFEFFGFWHQGPEFSKNFVIFRVLLPQEPRNLLLGLMIDYCTISSGIGMVLNILASRILALFWQNLQFFFSISLIVIFQAFQELSKLAKKPSLEFDNKWICGTICGFYSKGHWKVFQLFNVANFTSFLWNFLFSFSENFCLILVFSASRNKEPPLGFANGLLGDF